MFPLKTGPHLCSLALPRGKDWCGHQVDDKNVRRLSRMGGRGFLAVEFDNLLRSFIGIFGYGLSFPKHDWNQVSYGRRGTSDEDMSSKQAKSVSYEALSYTWGSASNARQILVNGRRFEITKNLWFALQFLQRDSSSRTLWIDSICINQTDNDEKGSLTKPTGSKTRSNGLHTSRCCTRVRGLVFNIPLLTGPVMVLGVPHKENYSHTTNESIVEKMQFTPMQR